MSSLQGKSSPKNTNRESFFPATAPTEWLGDSRCIEYTVIPKSIQENYPFGLAYTSFFDFVGDSLFVIHYELSTEAPVKRLLRVFNIWASWLVGGSR
jgi:hypothetical protein